MVTQYDALCIRDFLAHRAAPGQRAEPLSVADHLTVLALSEAIALRARQFRGTEMDAALGAGATWLEVGTAVNATATMAKERYRAWADGQHMLWRNTPPGCRPIGLDDEAHAAALARLEDDREASDTEEGGPSR
jgi:hypothetical protein